MMMSFAAVRGALLCLRPCGVSGYCLFAAPGRYFRILVSKSSPVLPAERTVWDGCAGGSFCGVLSRRAAWSLVGGMLHVPLLPKTTTCLSRLYSGTAVQTPDGRSQQHRKRKSRQPKSRGTFSSECSGHSSLPRNTLSSRNAAPSRRRCYSIPGNNVRSERPQ